MKDIKVGGTSINTAKGQYAIADTGTSLLYMLESDYVSFSSMITAASPDFICTSIFYDYCYSNTAPCDTYWPMMKNMTIVLDNNEYTIPPAGYTLSNGDLDGHACSVAVSYSADSMGLYILGDTFLRNFVSTYDYKANEIRLAVNVNAPDGTIAVAHPSSLNMMYVIGGGIAALIILICICKVCCGDDKKKKKKKRKQDERLTATTVNSDSDSD